MNVYMRIIRTLNKGNFTAADAEMVAAELVNIYHGTKYYEGRGRLQFPIPNYLAIEHKDFTDFIIPHSGQIIISGGNSERTWRNKTIKMLETAWAKMNRWPRQDPCHTTSNKGFMSIDEIAPTNRIAFKIFAKAKDRKVYKCDMLWTVKFDHDSADVPILASPVRDMDKQFLSVSTIFVDMTHEEHLSPTPFSLTWPALPSHIKIMSDPLSIHYKVGIQAHLYYHYTGELLGMLHPLATKCYMPDEKSEAENCEECKIHLWSKFYSVNKKIICAFCVHGKLGGGKPTDDIRVHTHSRSLVDMINMTKWPSADVTAAVKFFMDHSVTPDSLYQPYNEQEINLSIGKTYPRPVILYQRAN